MLEDKFRFDDLQIFYREAGAGQPILLLHCAGGTSAQWRKLMNHMSDRYRLMAVDLLSHGQSDEVPTGSTDGIDLEVQTVRACMERTGSPVHLVGHSAGGRAATRFAIKYPDKVKCLVLYEPALFGIMANGADHEGWDGYMRLCTGMIDHIDADDETGAAEVMVDYWSAPGTFQSMPPEQKEKVTYGIRAATRKARKFIANPDEHAINASQIQAPTLVLSGAASPRSARGVTDILARDIRNAQLHRIDGVGHMAPLTHAAQVNSFIEKHIQAHTD